MEFPSRIFGVVRLFILLLQLVEPHRPSSDLAGDRYASARLLLTSSEPSSHFGIVVKKVDDNLTLSCTLVDADNTTLPVDNVEFNLTFPHQDSNRSHTWTEGNTLHLTIESLQSSDAGQYTCIVPNSQLFAHAVVAVKPISNVGSIPFCGAMMFSCSDEPSDLMGVKCVPFSFLCDGLSDCPDPGRDESPETCGTTDPCSDKLRCSNNRCIPKSWCCIGQNKCLPHPCCAEHMLDIPVFPFAKTGGGLTNNPNEPYLLQATLYKACAFVILVVVTVSIFISAICKVRLKRIAESQGHLPIDYHLDIPSPDLSERHMTNYSTSSPAAQDCQYSLVRYADADSNYEVMNAATTCPPSYSEYLAQSNQQFNGPSSPTSPSTTQEVDNARTRNNVTDSQREDSSSTHNSPARRPNDFGMGLIANAIFNTRYRPVPQQNFEITSLDYATDSDSSGRSPAARIPNNPLNVGTVEFNSHFYGERVGGSPEINHLRGLSDNRRLRHANALDRILDRFGLNAPYNVDINRDNRTTWECQSFISPTESDNQNSNRRRALSTIWTRLKDRFTRNHQSDRSNGRENRSANNNTSQIPSGNFNSGRNRRRPDTPDVPETTFNNRQPHTLTCFLSEDRRLDMCGNNFGEINYQRGFIFSRDLRLVPAHSFPPPYSQFAPDPPPPYVSRENLIASRADLNNVGSSVPDQNGNVVVINDPQVRGGNVVTDSTDNTEVRSNTVDSNVCIRDNSTHSFVAFDRCDDNGNVEQFSADGSEVLAGNCDSKCADGEVCDARSSASVREFKASVLKSFEESEEPSTSTGILNRNYSVNETTASKLCNINNNVDTLDTKKSLQKKPSGSDDEMNGNLIGNYDCGVPGKKERSDSTRILSDQSNSSVHSGDPQVNFESSILEVSRTTDECDLVFPPNNLEFIDSDINEDRNRIEV